MLLPADGSSTLSAKRCALIANEKKCVTIHIPVHRSIAESRVELFDRHKQTISIWRLARTEQWPVPLGIQHVECVFAGITCFTKRIINNHALNFICVPHRLLSIGSGLRRGETLHTSVNLRHVVCSDQQLVM